MPIQTLNVISDPPAAIGLNPSVHVAPRAKDAAEKMEGFAGQLSRAAKKSKPEGMSPRIRMGQGSEEEEDVSLSSCEDAKGQNPSQATKSDNISMLFVAPLVALTPCPPEEPATTEQRAIENAPTAANAPSSGPFDFDCAATRNMEPATPAADQLTSSPDSNCFAKTVEEAGKVERATGTTGSQRKTEIKGSSHLPEGMLLEDREGLEQKSALLSLGEEVPVSEETPPPESLQTRSPHGSRVPKENHSQELTHAYKDSPSVDGIAAAKQEGQMNCAVEMDEAAGQTEKNLPGGSLSSNGFPREGSLVSKEPRFERSFEPNPVAAHSPAFAYLPPTEAKTDIAAASIGTPAIERVERALLEGIARVQHSDADRISVTITPQPGTQISLRVEMRDGNVSAHLGFQNGDRQLLDSNWQDLQRRMAEQGIQLHRSDSGESGVGSFGRQSSQSQKEFTEPQHSSRGFQPSSAASAEKQKLIAIPRVNRSILERWA